MRDNFEASLKEVLLHEGGFVDHPRDPGGATNKGITLAAYRSFMGSSQFEAHHLKRITDEEVSSIYRLNYWGPKADKLPLGLDYCYFDASVNSGPRQATKWLEAAQGNGSEQPRSTGAVINAMCDRRLGFMQGLKTWDVFGKGWARRVAQARAKALAMAGGQEAVKSSLQVKEAEHKTITDKQAEVAIAAGIVTTGTSVSLAIKGGSVSPWVIGGIILVLATSIVLIAIHNRRVRVQLEALREELKNG
jgi:lysozyme family protein